MSHTQTLSEPYAPTHQCHEPTILPPPSPWDFTGVSSAVVPSVITLSISVAAVTKLLLVTVWARWLRRASVSDHFLFEVKAEEQDKSEKLDRGISTVS